MPVDDIALDTPIPHLLQRHPQARRVLDRYGLRGCGGSLGPDETLRFFAKMHGVDETNLLAELTAAVDSRPEKAAPDARPGIADTIYRRYFAAGVAVMLSVGAAWGVLILWKIGFAGRFTGVSIHEVNAHGHAQIFGWVGLFIMGFGYQAFPRFWQAALPAPRLAVAAFGAMLAGIVLSMIGGVMHARMWAPPAVLLGAALETGAIGVFALQIAIAFRRGAARFEPYVAFIFAALLCFVLQSPLSGWHTWRTMTAPSYGEMLLQVQAFQPVLRGLQVHGLALLMVLGVSQRLLPGAYGLPAIRARRAWICFAMLSVGVAGEAVLLLVHGLTHDHVWAALVFVPWVMLAAGSLGLAWPWRLWRPVPQPDRSAKFIRAAYGWLAVSMVMLLLLPLYQAAADVAFSHAYYGAIRHAITVGFVSMMIMGVAAKAAPTLAGVPRDALPSLVGPFVLVNAGCFLRVSLQTLTDWLPVGFALVGISGVVELAGFAWWGLHILSVLRYSRSRGRAASMSPPAELRPEHTVGDVLQWHPHLIETFVRFGFAPLRNPVLRRTLARGITIREAARMQRVDEEALMQALRTEAVRPAGDKRLAQISIRATDE